MSPAPDPIAATPADPGSRVRAVFVYTFLRVALFVGVWLVLQFLTPVKGLLAVVAALLISGAISVVVLDRPRGEFGAVAAGFFGRINARIDAASRAEDVDDERITERATPPASAGGPDEVPGGSGEAEQQRKDESVDEQ